MTSDYTLAYGTHPTPEDGRCAMEWVAHLAGEPHSDDPACVSPVLRAMCIALNDSLDDVPRQRLRPYLARTIGTASDGLDRHRAWLAMDWLIRTYTARWLIVGGLSAHAERLATLPEVHDERALRRALRPLHEARRAAHEERARVFGVSRLGGWSGALTAGHAGREAAWACAGAAAWAAARLGVGDMAGDRARAAARCAAGDAAAAAARRARLAHPEWTPRRATQAALVPTREALTTSALALLDRMLPTELIAVPAPATHRAVAAV